MTDAERFWSKVDRSGGPDACWLWTAGRAALRMARASNAGAAT